jgi:ribokinase
MPKHLVVVGSVNADLYMEVERLPRPGETIAGRHAAVRPGGKGGNQAGAAARLGQKTFLVAQTGDDAFAGPLKAALGEAGVALDHVTVSAGDSGQALILLQQGGENSIVIVGGANQRWSGIGGEAAARIAGGGALLLQREVPDAVNLDAARAAKGAGVPVVLDLGGVDKPPPPGLLALVDVLSPNETELGRLTGMPTESDEQVIAAARSLHGRGVGSVLVKLGARGALLVPAKGEPVRHPAFLVRVVDTTGAGDCFTAAYSVALLEGKPERERLRFACAAAALCVQQKGALPSMPKRADVDHFLSAQASEAAR